MTTPDVAGGDFATALSNANAAAGRIAYRGVALDDLVASATFEEACALIYAGRLPTAAQLADTNVRLAANRALPDLALAWLATLPRSSAPLDVLRTAVSALGTFVPHLVAGPPSARHALALIAKLPTIVAAWDRLRRNLAPLAPSPGLSTAANLLYMRSGRPPAAEAERALDAVLVAFADRGVDARALAARIVAGADGDLVAAVTAALAATTADGFDPDEAPGNDVGYRSPTLASLASEVAANADPAWRRRYASFERPNDRSADFSASAIVCGLGIATDTVASVVACARVAGWAAHVLERRSSARPASPHSTYTGPVDVPWVAIDRRIDPAPVPGRA